MEGTSWAMENKCSCIDGVLKLYMFFPLPLLRRDDARMSVFKILGVKRGSAGTL